MFEYIFEQNRLCKALRSTFILELIRELLISLIYIIFANINTVFRMSDEIFYEQSSEAIQQVHQDLFQEILSQGSNNHQLQSQGQNTSSNLNSETMAVSESTGSRTTPPGRGSKNLFSKMRAKIYGLIKKINITKRVFKTFLDENNAACNQLLVLFTYLFLKRENTSLEGIKLIRNGLLEYLRQQLKEAQNSEGKDKEASAEKIKVNILLVERYFGGGDEEIDIEWVRNVGEKMYGGRQKKAINRPLEKIEKLQREIIRSQPLSIQQFFENFKE